MNAEVPKASAAAGREGARLQEELVKAQGSLQKQCGQGGQLEAERRELMHLDEMMAFTLQFSQKPSPILYSVKRFSSLVWNHCLKTVLLRNCLFSSVLS